MSVKGKMSFLPLFYPASKIELCFTKNKIPTLQNSYSDVLPSRLLSFKSLIGTTIEVYKFHALINRNRKKTLQRSYDVIVSKLQCDSFKLPK